MSIEMPEGGVAELTARGGRSEQTAGVARAASPRKGNPGRAGESVGTPVQAAGATAPGRDSNAALWKPPKPLATLSTTSIRCSRATRGT
jgi:hypothetical protein